MFEVKEWRQGYGNCYLSEGGHNFLHSDGTVYVDAVEYWPTRELAQAVLDKYQSKPKHVWEHGDVFENETPTKMICIAQYPNPIRVFCCGQCSGHSVKETESFLRNGRFLFNIREKL